MSQPKDPQLAGVLAMLANLPTDPDAPMAERRPGLDAFADIMPMPEGCSYQVGELGGVACERYQIDGADPKAVILFVHGGGYCIGSAKSHRHMIARLAKSAGTTAVSLDYRLAPEIRFPAPVDDALAAYRALLAEGFAPGKIAISGDSAGGGLTVALAMAIRDAGLTQPAALFPMSPWVDLTQQGAAYDALKDVDPMLTQVGLQGFADAYLGDRKPVDNPLSSPLFGDVSGLAPMFIQAGGAEILMSDAVRLAEKVGLAGGEVQLQIWPEMIHIWQIFWPMLDAGGKALDAGAAFIRSKMA